MNRNPTREGARMVYLFLAVGLALLAASGTQGFEIVVRAPTMITVQATDSRVQQAGRFHATASNTLVGAWSGGELVIRFTGDALDVVLHDLAPPSGGEQNYFAVSVDSNAPTVLATTSNTTRYTLASGLGPGPHVVRLFKRTEAVVVGQAEVAAFEIANGEALPPDPAPTRRIELVGDSITCGYGNEALSPSENFKPSTENNYLTYGQIAARHFGAEGRVVAWSGQGVYRQFDGTTGHPIPTVYDQVLPPSTNILWNFAQWTPDVVVINLGTNDFQPGEPDHDTFVNTYVDFVKRVAQLNGGPYIFCCLGPNLKDGVPEGTTYLTTARNYIQEVVQICSTSGVPDISFLEFATLQGGEYGADYHPNVLAHQRMATNLIAAISGALGW